MMPLDTTPQVLHNRFLAAEANGFDSTVYGVAPDEFSAHLSRVLNPSFYAVAKATNPDLWEGFEYHCEKGRLIRNTFADFLERTLEPRFNFDLDLDWRFSQKQCLEGIIHAYRSGYQRPPFEVPMGVGKSLIFGAAARAYLEAIDALHGKPGFENLKDESEVYLFTSRIALTEQFVTSRVEEVVTAEPFTDEISEMPIKLGDVSAWMDGFLPDTGKQIRVLAGSRGAKSSELAKNSRVTISTYAGLTQNRIDNVFRKKMYPFCEFDEAHRVTDRIRMLLNNSCLSGGPWLAGSGTIVGPGRDIYDLWERIEDPEDKLNQGPEWHDGLAYHASLTEAIERGESPPIRYLEMEPQIDISEANGASRKELNQKSVDEILSMNVSGLKAFLRELLLSNHPVLNVSESKGVLDRSWLAFVSRVAMAQELADYINGDLQEAIIEKTGQPFKAAYVDGKMSEKAYNDTIADFESGKIQVIFSCEKIGEGVDIKGVTGIMPLRPYGHGSEWKLRQEVGRGRINPDSPDDDLLVVDGMFHSQRHQLASIMGILGQHRTISGGLLAGNLDRIKAERRVYQMIANAMPWQQIWSSMTTQERQLLPFVQRISALPPGALSTLDNREMDVEIVKIVEREDVFFNLATDSPKKAIDYARMLLRRRYPNTEAFKRAVRNPLFAQQSFGAVGRGVDLINLVLGENNRLNLSGKSINTFIEVIGEILEIELAEEVDAQDLTKVQSFFAVHFGKVPEPGAKSNTGYFSSQSSIILGGLNYASPVINARDIETAKTQSLIALKTVVEAAMAPENEFLGSRISSDVFGENYVGAVLSIGQILGCEVKFTEGPVPVPGENFTCGVEFLSTPKFEIIIGRGNNKKAAKTNAAQILLSRLMNQSQADQQTETGLNPAEVSFELGRAEQAGGIQSIEFPGSHLIHTSKEPLPEFPKVFLLNKIRQKLGLDPQGLFPEEHRPTRRTRKVDIEGEIYYETIMSWQDLESDPAYVLATKSKASELSKFYAMIDLSHKIAPPSELLDPFTEDNFHLKPNGVLKDEAITKLIKNKLGIHGKFIQELAVEFVPNAITFDGKIYWSCQGQWRGMQTQTHYSENYRAAHIAAQSDLWALIEAQETQPLAVLEAVNPPQEQKFGRANYPTPEKDSDFRLHEKIKQQLSLDAHQSLPSSKQIEVKYREVSIEEIPYWEYILTWDGKSSKPFYARSGVVAREWAAADLLKQL